MGCEWIKTTKSGDRSDLSFLPTESLWQRINSESDSCRGQLCPHKDKCFVMKVKKEASSAQEKGGGFPRETAPFPGCTRNRLARLVLTPVIPERQALHLLSY